MSQPTKISNRKPFVSEQLRKNADLFEQRNVVYGSNYLSFGHVMMALHPDGLVLDTEDKMNQAGVWFHLVDKMSRYANHINRGMPGHSDSMNDISVYATIMREVDENIALKSKSRKK